MTLRFGTAAILGLMTPLILCGGQAAVDETLSIGDRACLFLDDRFVAEQSGLKRTWHQGKPQAEAVIGPDHWPHMFGSVLYDPVSKLYKMWYEDIHAGRGGVFYAESTDGKKWTRPNLGLVELKKSKDNNCILFGAELPNVFLDPNESDPQARFKMFAWGGPFGPKKFSGHILFSSADGIRWNVIGPYGMPSPTDESGQARVVLDTNEVFWDSLGKRYMGTYRTFPLHPGLMGFARDEKYRTFPKDGGHRRGVGITTSKTLQGGWSRTVTVLKADAKDDEKVRKLGRGTPSSFAELYIMPAFVYGNHYLGMVSLLFQVDPDEKNMNDGVPLRADIHPGGGDLQLTFSHDGMKWFRQPERQTLIAPGPTKLIPCYAPCNPPLELGDELWLYYTEATSAHPAADDKSAIRAAVWRRDGFVSLDADTKGTLTTRPIQFEGNRLIVNVEATDARPARGQLRVGILDDAGKPIPGFDLKDCDPLRGNQVKGTATWAGKSDLSPLKGRAVRLQMELSRCSLYSFRIAK